MEPQDDIVFEPYSTSTQDHTNFVRSAMMTGKLGGAAMHSDSTSAGSTNQNTSSWATNQRPRKSMTFIDHGLVSHLEYAHNYNFSVFMRNCNLIFNSNLISTS